MRLIFFISVLFLCSISVNGQVKAIKTKLFFWGDLKSNFHSNLTSTGRRLFDSVFVLSKVDTIHSIKLTGDDFFELLSANRLKDIVYQTFTLTREAAEISVVTHINNKVIPGPEVKLLLKYSKDDDDY